MSSEDAFMRYAITGEMLAEALEKSKQSESEKLLAAQRLCEIYFSLLEKYLSADTIRKLVDDATHTKVKP